MSTYSILAIAHISTTIISTITNSFHQSKSPTGRWQHTEEIKSEPKRGGFGAKETKTEFKKKKYLE